MELGAGGSWGEQFLCFQGKGLKEGVAGYRVIRLQQQDELTPKGGVCVDLFMSSAEFPLGEFILLSAPLRRL